MRFFLITLVTTVLLQPTFIEPAFAGAGHDHGESSFVGAASPATDFTLTKQQFNNLDIRSTKVELMPIQKTVDMLAFTELLPEKQAVISPRFGGKILNISVAVGEKVRKGQKLVTIEPVTVGNSRVVLYAPIDGFVMNLSATKGQVIEAGHSIMRIGDPKEMLVRGVLYETPDVNSIKVGQSVEVHLDIDPNRHIHGLVQRINRVIDTNTRTFSVYALIQSPQGNIQPGLQAKMEVFISDDNAVMAVPKKAVLGEMGNLFVYVINDLHIERKEVVTGIKSGHHIEIKSGLSPDDTVVIQGNYQLQYISVGGVKTHDHDHKSHNHKELKNQPEHKHHELSLIAKVKQFFNDLLDHHEHSHDIQDLRSHDHGNHDHGNHDHDNHEHNEK